MYCFKRNKDLLFKFIRKEIFKLFIFSLRTIWSVKSQIACQPCISFVRKLFPTTFSLLLVIIFSWTPFFEGFYVILIWSLNYHYISKYRPLKKCNQQKKSKLTYWPTILPSFTLLAQCAQLLPKSAWLLGV